MSTTGVDAGTRDVSAPPSFHGRPLGRLSVAQYEAMVESGVLTKHDRLELIEGHLVQKMTKGMRRCVAADCFQQALQAVLPSGWFVRVEKPVRFPGRMSLPEPDLSVVRGKPRDYLNDQPGPADVALVVEVSDSSLAADRALAATYLGGGVPEYWLLNLAEEVLEVHRPGQPVRVLGTKDAIDLVLDGAAAGRIAVADLLPRG